MSAWISANLGNIIVVLVLAALAFFSVRTIVNNKRHKRTSCGCCSASCPKVGSEVPSPHCRK